MHVLHSEIFFFSCCLPWEITCQCFNIKCHKVSSFRFWLNQSKVEKKWAHSFEHISHTEISFSVLISKKSNTCNSNIWIHFYWLKSDTFYLYFFHFPNVKSKEKKKTRQEIEFVVTIVTRFRIVHVLVHKAMGFFFSSSQQLYKTEARSFMCG